MEKISIKNRSNNLIDLHIYQAESEKACLIIAHGASEHINRYVHFSKFLNENNISVIGYNHLGHGPNRLKEDVYFSNEKGDEILVNDLEDVYQYAKEKYNVPILLFGHSMGSLILRSLCISTNDLLDGVILCGSLHPHPITTQGGLLLANTISLIKGKEKASNFLNKLAFKDLEKVISYNEKNVEEYRLDKDCQMKFSNQAIIDLMNIINKITNKNNISKMIKTNYFIISGEDDLFSNKTKQIDEFISLLDKDVDYSCKYYPNAKHEILNEDIKEEVYQDVLNFINAIVNKKR